MEEETVKGGNLTDRTDQRMRNRDNIKTGGTESSFGYVVFRKTDSIVELKTS